MSKDSSEGAETVCPYCHGEKEIEMDNNGPTGPCPVCCGETPND